MVAMSILFQGHATAVFTAGQGADFDSTPVATFGATPVWEPPITFDSEPRAVFGGARTVRTRFDAVSNRSNFFVMPSGVSVPPPSYAYTEPWQVTVQTVYGSVVCDFSEASVTGMSKVLNADGDSASFKVPVTDARINLVNEPYHAAVFRRGNDTYFAGVVLSRRLVDDGSMVEFGVVGFRWWLAQRTVSRFPRRNLIGAGATWYPRVLPPAPAAKSYHGRPTVIARRNASRDTWTVGLSNTYKGRLLGTFKVDKQPDYKVYEGNNGFAEAELGWVVGKSGRGDHGVKLEGVDSDGDTFTLTAWLKIVSGGMIVPPYEERGLFMHFVNQLNSPVTTKDKVPPKNWWVTLQSVFVPINGSTPKDVWVRCQCAMTLPVAQKDNHDGTYTKVDATQTVGARVYCGTGYAEWKDVYLTWNERLSFKTGASQADIVRGVMGVAQSASHGKSSLGMPVVGSSGGPLRENVYLYSNHENVNDIITSFNNLHDGMDVSIDQYGVSGTRTFQMYGNKGSYKPFLLFTGDGGNVIEASCETKGDDCENQVVVYAEGSTATKVKGKTADNGVFDDQGREEGYYSAPVDGVILEGFHGANPSTSPDSFNSQAQHLVAYYGRRVQIVTVTVADGPGRNWWLYVDVGDSLPIDIHNDQFSVTGQFRVMSKSYDAGTGKTTFNMVDAATAYRP